MPFTLTSTNEILTYKFNKIQDLFKENHNTLVEEIKEELNKWRNIPRLSIGRFNGVRMSGLPGLKYRVHVISTKIPASYFVDIEKVILKLT